LREPRDSLAKILRIAIVQNDYSKPIRRIIELASRASGVDNQINILFTARDEDVHGWSILTQQSQLWPVPLLQDENVPE